MIFTLAEVAAVFLVPEEQKLRRLEHPLIGVGIIKGIRYCCFLHALGR
ncbi:MAG: hypothetical protein CM15mP128_1970 [Methanobacteriota archaeon]|nr:MAG: hypothetical protein CM15mP128_1970 [Euryarchaeota archaeon]